MVRGPGDEERMHAAGKHHPSINKGSISAAVDVLQVA